LWIDFPQVDEFFSIHWVTVNQTNDIAAHVLKYFEQG